MREGNFSLEGVGPGFDLAGKTVGVIGTGKIGECFVRIMMGLGCRVIGYDMKKSPVLLKLAQQQQEPVMGSGSFEYREFDDVLQASEILSLHLPLNPQTRGLINRENLDKMKKVRWASTTAGFIGQLVFSYLAYLCVLFVRVIQTHIEKKYTTGRGTFEYFSRCVGG